MPYGYNRWWISTRSSHFLPRFFLFSLPYKDGNISWRQRYEKLLNRKRNYRAKMLHFHSISSKKSFCYPYKGRVEIFQKYLTRLKLSKNFVRSKNFQKVLHTNRNHSPSANSSNEIEKASTSRRGYSLSFWMFQQFVFLCSYDLIFENQFCFYGCKINIFIDINQIKTSFLRKI